MKVSLVVAQGVHEGKAIPIPLAEFLIGRDPQCQLRPASQAISKQHCGVLTRGDQVFVKDFGSTNGTFVNGEPVTGEVEVKHNDLIKAGPLEFKLRIERPAPKADSKAGTPASGVAVAKADSKVGIPAVGVKTDGKASVPAVGVKADSKPPLPAVAKAEAKPAEPTEENLAALLLGLDDETPEGGQVPDGSTVMEMAPLELKDDKAKAAPVESNSNVAADILKMYTRRNR